LKTIVAPILIASSKSAGGAVDGALGNVIRLPCQSFIKIRNQAVEAERICAE
jgi:hypothetical protein